MLGKNQTDIFITHFHRYTGYELTKTGWNIAEGEIHVKLRVVLNADILLPCLIYESEWILLNLSVAEIIIFQENLKNTMVADVVALCVVRAAAAIIDYRSMRKDFNYLGSNLPIWINFNPRMDE